MYGFSNSSGRRINKPCYKTVIARRQMVRDVDGIVGGCPVFIEVFHFVFIRIIGSRINAKCRKRKADGALVVAKIVLIVIPHRRIGLERFIVNVGFVNN